MSGDPTALITALRDWRQQFELSKPWPDSEFTSRFPELPLFHRLGEPLRDAKAALGEKRVLLEISKGKAARAGLNTDSCLFASIGVAANHSPPIVIAFGPVCEFRASRLSAPWDTRGAGSAAGWTDEVHAAKIAQYSLLATDDEAYLALHLATYFLDWQRFLDGGRPVNMPDEPRVLASTSRRPLDEDLSWLTTPEARFTEDQPIGEGQLLATLVDADYPDTSPAATDWRRTYHVLASITTNCGGRFFKVQRELGAPDLQSRAAEFVCEWLLEKGLPL